MGRSKSLWDITNKPSTKSKLELLKKCFGIWIKIWNKQNWAEKEWYVIDLFAGKGEYIDCHKAVSGSPLIFLEVIAELQSNLNPEIKINLFFVEKNREYFNSLEKKVKDFISRNKQISNIVELNFYQDDCNHAIEEILNSIENTNKNPLFVLIDPSGLQIKKPTVEKIVNLANPKDIMFNYILEGVRRTHGVAKKALLGTPINQKEIKTVNTLIDFIGDDIDFINRSDLRILKDYVDSIFTSKNLNIVAYDMKYPDRDDTLYYLLFASRKLSITKIVKDIYASQKESSLGKSLFGKQFYEDNLVTIEPYMETIERKSLLYRTGVEYGNWTINHIQGCMHGCKFPCYAFMISKKFGRVKDYEEWLKPKIVINALELLEKELSLLTNKIDFVHLSFMTDPFMFDFRNNELNKDIKNLTLRIIERLNRKRIKVTTLTKGYYPIEILDNKFQSNNEYGVTLVSLNKKFKEEFEPFSAPYKTRIESLKKLHESGLKTWVSIEPFPTPNLDETAINIDSLLNEIGFVDKIIFGKMNYNIKSTRFFNSKDFYEATALKVIRFCDKNDIKYHIKFGTPFSQENTKAIFKDIY